MLNKLIEKYKDYPFDEEFPNLYMVLIYESGGDLTTLSEQLGYVKYQDFNLDYKEFIETYETRT